MPVATEAGERVLGNKKNLGHRYYSMAGHSQLVGVGGDEVGAIGSQAVDGTSNILSLASQMVGLETKHQNKEEEGWVTCSQTTGLVETLVQLRVQLQHTAKAESLKTRSRTFLLSSLNNAS